MSSPSPQQQDWDTNLDWWIDKPERKARNAAASSTYRPLPRKADRVWAEAALVVGLVLALSLSLISLATR